MRPRMWVAGASIVLVLLQGCGAAEDDPAGSADEVPAVSPERAAAYALVELAVLGEGRVPWARAVTYSVGGVEVGTFGPGRNLVGHLSGCPAGVERVEGRRCPVSPLDVIAGVSGDPVIEGAVPARVGCNEVGAPRVPESLVVAVVRPPETERNCFEDFAVLVYVDGDGRIAWIDLSLSGP